MIIETERLILREPRITDVDDMYNNWASDPEVTKYLTWNYHKDKEETKTILQRWVNEIDDPKVHRFVITLKEDQKAVGSIDVVDYDEKDGSPEIGYCISRKLWNKGYMTETAKAFIDYLFKKGFKKVHIGAYVENIASNRVIQKCGFTFTHQEYREHCSIFKPEPVTINWYEIVKKQIGLFPIYFHFT